MYFDYFQMNILVNKSDAGRPLWLTIACEELRVFGEFRKLTKVIQDLPQDLIGLLEMVKYCPGPEIMKLFTCSTQLSIKFQRLIKAKMMKHIDFSFYQPLNWCIYPANKYKNANNYWHFNIYEQDKFCALFSLV